MSEKLIIDASTIREGGAFVLLQYIISRLEHHNMVYEIIGNTYIKDKISPSNNIKPLNLYHIFLLYVVGRDRCLYFCSRSPLICKKNSYVYIQTYYLTYALREIFRLDIPSSRKVAHIINLFSNKIARIISNHKVLVQTESMKKRLSRNQFSIEIMPIFPPNQIEDFDCQIQWDYCYISYPWPHKNHKLLLESMLAANIKNGFSLALTIPDDHRFLDLHELIQQVNNLGVFKVTNLGVISKDEVNKVYSKSKALLFMSSKESFGLPLIEAAQAGLPIFAPDLDYVNDVVEDVYYISLNDSYEFIDFLVKSTSADLKTPKLKVQDRVDELIEKLSTSKLHPSINLKI